MSEKQFRKLVADIDNKGFMYKITKIKRKKCYNISRNMEVLVTRKTRHGAKMVIIREYAIIFNRSISKVIALYSSLKFKE